MKFVITGRLDGLNEEWRDISGYEGLYQVSNLGRVRSLTRKITNNERSYLINGKILKENKLANGYLKVGLSANGNSKLHYIHRLGAQAFIPNPNSYPMVNHKDEDKTNNRVENLEWCTAKYNNDYSDVYHSRRKKVLQLSKNMLLIGTYISQCEAERKTGISQAHISQCCLGKRKTAGGYVWRFE